MPTVRKVRRVYVTAAGTVHHCRKDCVALRHADLARVFVVPLDLAQRVGAGNQCHRCHRNNNKRGN